MVEEDVQENVEDSDVVKSLKEKLARQATVHQASCKAMQDFLSLTLDGRRAAQEAAAAEVQQLREELQRTRLEMANQKPAVSIFFTSVAVENKCSVEFVVVVVSQHNVVDDMFSKMFPRNMVNREQLISGIEEDLHGALDKNVTAVKEKTADEQLKELKRVRDEYDEKARQVHRIHLEKETKLIDRIKQLERELRVSDRCSVVFS